jgi:hypothetical protein
MCNDFFLHVGQLPNDNESESPNKKFKSSEVDDALAQAFGAVSTQDADSYERNDVSPTSLNAVDNALAQAFGAITTHETELDDALTQAFGEINAQEEVNDGTDEAVAGQALDARPQSPLSRHQQQLALSESEVAELALWWESDLDPLLDL